MRYGLRSGRGGGSDFLLRCEAGPYEKYPKDRVQKHVIAADRNQTEERRHDQAKNGKTEVGESTELAERNRCTERARCQHAPEAERRRRQGAELTNGAGAEEREQRK